MSPYCKVEEHSLGDQASRDRPQPSHDNICRVASEAAKHQDTRDNLNDAHKMHECWRRHVEQPRNDGIQVHIPVGKQVEELVQSSEYRA